MVTDADIEGGLWKFVWSVLPSVEDAKAASEIHACIAAAAKEALGLPAGKPDVCIELFGSSANGFGEGSADLDFTIDGAAYPGSELLLRKMHKALVTKPVPERRLRVQRYVPRARVPVLSLVDSRSGRMADVTVSNGLAVHSASLLKAYSDIDPRCRALVLVVKRYVKSKGLSGAARGYLSSYALTLLVIFYLQTLPTDSEDGLLPLPSLQAHAGRPEMFEESGRHFNVGFASAQAAFACRGRSSGCGNAERKLSLLSLVRGFFAFYTSNDAWEKEVISVRLGKRTLSDSAAVSEVAATKRSAPICIEDPFDQQRNLGSAISPGRAAMLQRGFRSAAAMLESARSSREFLDQLLSSDAVDLDLGVPVSIDTCLVTDALTHHRVRPESSKSNQPGSLDGPYIFKFEHDLDEYQKRAIWAIENGDSLVLSAPTGAGKTAVAEYAIAKTLSTGKPIIFCSPVKALSNQKYAELARKFPGRVGLLTGDVATATKRSVLVVTTEVLQSLIRHDPSMLASLSTVIYDEVHFLGDRERGVTWEETLILLPPQAAVLCFSATAPNILDIAGWISQSRHAPCHAICSARRPTPLQHFVHVGKGQRRLILDEKRVFHKENYQALQSLARDRTGASSRMSAWEVLEEQLAAGGHRIMPLLVFSFSKRECDAHARAFADKCSGSKLQLLARRISSFLGPEEAASVQMLLEQALRREHHAALPSQEQVQRILERIKRVEAMLEEGDQRLPQVTLFLSSLLPCGIAVHHAGILPCLRELTELLFQDGLLSALFCTETCGLGLNLPVRSVLFSFKEGAELQKWDGSRQRLLLPSEYTQVSGRAGRRGKDAKGSAIVCLANEVDEGSFLRVVLRPPEAIGSSFHMSCGMILNLLRFGHHGYLGWFARQSFKQFESQGSSQQSALTHELAPMLESLQVLGFLSEDYQLLAKGRAASIISSGFELLLCTLISDDLLTEAQPTQVWAFLSRFLVEPLGKACKDAEQVEHPEEEWLQALQQKASKAAAALDDVFASHGLSSHLRKSLEKHRGAEGAVLQWLAGATFSHALSKSPGLDPGTFVTLLRRIERLAHQMICAAAFLKKTELVSKFEDGMVNLKRGLPFKDTLYVAEVSAITSWRPAFGGSIGTAGTEAAVPFSNCAEMGVENERVTTGSAIFLSPNDIGFYHSSFSEFFDDGRSIRGVVAALMAGTIQFADLGQLKVHWCMGKFFSLCNRVLAVLRLFAQFGPHEATKFQIPAEVVSCEAASSWGFGSKLTTGRWGGSCARIRESGEVVGNDKRQTTVCLEAGLFGLPPTQASGHRFKIAYWQALESLSCTCEVAQVLASISTYGEDPDLEAFRGSYELSLGVDPKSLTAEQLAKMDPCWTPCKDHRCMQPGCSDANGIPCTRKLCSGVFEKTGQPCLFCHNHSPRTLQKYEAFRGFARKARSSGMETFMKGKGNGKNAGKRGKR